MFEAFWSDDPGAALMHGPTYMANPLACAAANASLDLFETGDWRGRRRARIEAGLREGLAPCRDAPGVVDVRVQRRDRRRGVRSRRSTPRGLCARFVDEGRLDPPDGQGGLPDPAVHHQRAELERLTGAIRRVVGPAG